MPVRLGVFFASYQKWNDWKYNSGCINQARQGKEAILEYGSCMTVYMGDINFSNVKQEEAWSLKRENEINIRIASE